LPFLLKQKDDGTFQNSKLQLNSGSVRSLECCVWSWTRIKKVVLWMALKQ